jgi:hypothetical protein
MDFLKGSWIFSTREVELLYQRKPWDSSWIFSTREVELLYQRKPWDSLSPTDLSFFIFVATSFLCTKIFLPVSYNSISFHFNHNDFINVLRDLQIINMLAGFLSLTTGFKNNHIWHGCFNNLGRCISCSRFVLLFGLVSYKTN